MKTFEEYALTYTRPTLYYTVTDLSETLDEVEVDYLIAELQTIQSENIGHTLVLRTETDYTITVGYYDQEPMKEFETRLKRAYKNYVYGETQTMKAKMTHEELKAFEIKELEDELALLKDKLAKLKDNA